MRRLWLLLALVVPVLVVATAPPTPSTGQITFPTVKFTNEDQYVNIEECSSPTATIHLGWSPSYNVTGAVARSYVLYAANKTSTLDCPTAPDPSAGLIAGTVATWPSTTVNDVEFSTAAIAAAAFGPTACTSTINDNQSIFLCMQAKDSNDGTGNDVGTARGTLTLALSRPAAPVIGSAMPGEQAVNVSWSAGSGGAATSDSYLLQATPIGTTAASSATSPRLGVTSYRLSGLTNDVPYSVTVTAYSVASNPSDPSAAVSVTPSHVLDFYSEYKAAGGQELGGCAGGAAGPVALVAAAAALLAVRRRRK